MSTINDSVPRNIGETKVPFDVDKSPSVPGDDRKSPLDRGKDVLSREQLLSEQTKDPDIVRLSKRALSLDEADKVGECFYIQDGILMRKWRPPAPLQPIPAFEEPFSRVLVDCVGPLPRTRSGNQYLLTIIWTSTRFPEAIHLRNIKAKTIVKALTKFFSFVGAPKAIQSD